MLIASVLTNLIGIFVFLFIFWKRLKEDLASEMIFKLGFSIVAGVFIGLTFSLRLFPDYFLWSSFAGGVVGLSISVFKFRIKFYEIFESFIVAALPWVGFVFLLDSVARASLISFLGFLVVQVFIFISYYLSTHYKNFNWYKSGKIGFVGLSTLGIIFASRLVLAILKIDVLSFVSNFEAVMSGVGLLVCALLLVNLSRTKE